MIIWKDINKEEPKNNLDKLLFRYEYEFNGVKYFDQYLGFFTKKGKKTQVITKDCLIFNNNICVTPVYGKDKVKLTHWSFLNEPEGSI